MKYLLLIPFLAIAACDAPADPSGTDASNTKDQGLSTVEHDGHKFVIWKDYKKGTMIHHPGCECQSKEGKP